MANLVELFDNIVQMQNLNGVPLANGKMYVYALGRTRLMDTWSDVDGESLNSNPIILDAAGQCHCYVTDDFDYTIVATDEYNNEIFSIDKYLYSKGSHSHADVAVAPSETIAVSSYHVGECTIYVPYLTGQLGKVYEGIDPIVVNNTEDKISANHVPLGVQDPLYFVQDDEEGCIIGFSGQTVPEGVMTESALGFENDKITGYNGSAFSAGNEYEEGSYISIDNNVISVTGLSPVPTDTASTGLVASVSADIVSLIPSTAGLATTAQLDEKLDKADSANFLLTSDSGNFYPMDSNPSGYISELPSDLATTGWVDSQGYLTAVDIPESANWNSTYNTVSANSAQWAGGTANPRIPVTSTSGISIFESGDKVYFNISADYATQNWVTGQGYLTAETDWSDTITAASANAYNEATAAIPTGLATEDWVTAQGYLTTAYNPEFAYHDSAISSIDESALYDTSAHARINTLAGRISDLSSNKLDSSAFSDVSGNFLTAVPDTYLQNTDLTIADNKVTEISGIPLSAGTELEFEYDAADNISAINSSAISTTPSQALYAQNPLYFSATGTSSYMGINSADLARILGVDETVLFETTASPTAEANLSESWKNFDHLKICVQNLSNDNGWTYVEVKPLDRDGYTPYYNIVAGFSYSLETNGMIWQNIIGTATDTKLTNCSSFGFQNAETATSVTVRKNNTNDINCIRKVIGIGRKENV